MSGAIPQAAIAATQVGAVPTPGSSPRLQVEIGAFRAVRLPASEGSSPRPCPSDQDGHVAAVAAVHRTGEAASTPGLGGSRDVGLAHLAACRGLRTGEIA
jgi:hypothetical protein